MHSQGETTLTRRNGSVKVNNAASSQRCTDLANGVQSFVVFRLKVSWKDDAEIH